ncbi:MAG: M28 family peptidase, partial [Deltaproteobacteria bacterium]|nr:M28 family peptidase [Deltaproteobacteria bacterium]
MHRNRPPALPASPASPGRPPGRTLPDSFRRAKLTRLLLTRLLLTRLLLTRIMLAATLPALLSAWAPAVARADVPTRTDIPVFGHDLQVSLDPEQGRLEARDRITLPEKTGTGLEFMLHQGLAPTTDTPGVKLSRKGTANGPVPLEVFRLEFPAGTRRVDISYRGAIRHDQQSVGRETSRGFSSTPGVISAEGVFLQGASYWYPVFGNELVTFTLSARTPRGWKTISQGAPHGPQKTTDPVQWVEKRPQTEIYLIAAAFTEYSRQEGSLLSLAFLRSEDQGLANKYLDATGMYVSMYSDLLGPYPYDKFALVENFWETGFGMPSFTLLGSKVIRLPFILHSSYPHEILHNWWGNGVYPDYESGNWAEGLTAYLADHLIKEQAGQAAEHRFTSLQKYADYATGERDFALTAFRSRHGASSEAVGYGKTMMFFHMLRRELGDDTFRNWLREFYRRYSFRQASFDDLRDTLALVMKSSPQAGAGSGLDPEREFGQWVRRTGAPALQLKQARVTPAPGGTMGYLVEGTLEQTQPGETYRLRVPLAVTMENSAAAHPAAVLMEGRTATFRLNVPARPLRLDVDPEFDLFRRLDRREIPPAISQLLGAGNLTVVVPGGSALLEGYRGLARALAGAGPDNTRIVTDAEIQALPPQGALVLLGWENRLLGEALKNLNLHGVGLKSGPASQDITLNGEPVPGSESSVVLTAHRTGSDGTPQPLMFAASALAEALPGLGRKLPHYHKYSYLAFKGAEPSNTHKGKWPVTDSPLTVFFGQSTAALGALTTREPLAAARSEFSASRMMETVRALADSALEGRGFGTPGLARAGEHIAAGFRSAGLKPLGPDFRHPWTANAGKNGPQAELFNVLGMVPGSNPAFKGQSLVVGAHYDHLGRGGPDARAADRGQTHPGADDNASGVAVLLELARHFARVGTGRTIVFAAFSGEEQGLLGSRNFLKSLGPEANRKITAM